MKTHNISICLIVFGLALGSSSCSKTGSESENEDIGSEENDSSDDSDLITDRDSEETSSTDLDSDSDSDTDGDSDSDADTDGDSDSDADTDGDSDSGVDAGSDTETESDTEATESSDGLECNEPYSCVGENRCTKGTIQEIACENANQRCCLPTGDWHGWDGGVDSDVYDDVCENPYTCVGWRKCQENTIQDNLYCEGSFVCCTPL